MANLEDRLIALAGSYRARQEEHAAKAGWQGEHAEKATLLDCVVVDLERILVGDLPLTETEHAARRIRELVAAQHSKEPGGDAGLGGLDPNGVNEHGVPMCECRAFSYVHAWGPGESCPPERVFHQHSGELGGEVEG